MNTNQWQPKSIKCAEPHTHLRFYNIRTCSHSNRNIYEILWHFSSEHLNFSREIVKFKLSSSAMASDSAVEVSHFSIQTQTELGCYRTFGVCVFCHDLRTLCAQMWKHWHGACFNYATRILYLNRICFLVSTVAVLRNERSINHSPVSFSAYEWVVFAVPVCSVYRCISLGLYVNQ